MDLGKPASYETLAAGTPVFASDDTEIGLVRRVLAVPEDDIFDGLLIEISKRERFVDAESVAAIHERGVTLAISPAEAHTLPEPTANPGAITLDATDITESTGAERAHRIWNLISGKW